MTTSTNLQSETLRLYGIDSIDVTVEIARMEGESYHYAEDFEIEYVNHIPDRASMPLSYVADVAGYDDKWDYIFSEFEDELNRVAMEKGPQMEADAYYDYQSEKAEPDYE